MSKRYILRLCAGLLAIGAVAMPAAAQTNVVWKASDVHPLGYPTVEAVLAMGKKLETATHGRLRSEEHTSELQSPC